MNHLPFFVVQKELKKKPDFSEIRNEIAAEYEEDKRQIMREYDLLKKKFEQVMFRERKAREEVRNLRSQLIKRYFALHVQRSHARHADVMFRNLISDRVLALVLVLQNKS